MAEILRLTQNLQDLVHQVDSFSQRSGHVGAQPHLAAPAQMLDVQDLQPHYVGRVPVSPSPVPATETGASFWALALRALADVQFEHVMLKTAKGSQARTRVVGGSCTFVVSGILNNLVKQLSKLRSWPRCP